MWTGIESIYTYYSKYEDEREVEATKVGKGEMRLVCGLRGAVRRQSVYLRDDRRETTRGARGYPRRSQPYTKMPSSITKQNQLY